MVKVLLVDDDPDFVSFMVDCLKSNHRRVFTASDGVEALAIVKEHRPDLVLTDLMMPNMDGIELVKQIRAFDDEIYVVIISGHPDWKKKYEQVKDLAQLPLTKPVKVEDLLSAVELYIEYGK